MKEFRSAIFVLALALTVLKSFAQNDSVMHFSLTEAQNYAVQNFYVSKNSRLDMEAAKKRVWETTAIGLPQINASASYTYIPGKIPTIDFGSQIGGLLNPMFNFLDSIGQIDLDTLNFGEPSKIAQRTSLTYGFTISQLIFSGEYIVGLQAAKVYKAISELANAKTEMEIKEGVSTSYFAILVLKQTKILFEQTLLNLINIKGQTEKSYNLGLIEDTEVDQLKLSVKRTENGLNTINRQLELLNKLFAYLLGAQGGTSIELTDNLEDLIISNVINDSTYKFAVEDNIDYQIFGNQEKSMKLLMKREQSTYLPTIAGFYQYQDKTKKADFDFTLNHIVGIGVQVPIFTSGSRMVKVSQARIEYEKAQNMKEQETLRLIKEADQAIYDYRSALEEYNNEKENFALSEKVYNKTVIKYSHGMISSLDLTLVNNQYLQAQMTYSNAIQKLLSAKVALDKAYNKL